MAAAAKPGVLSMTSVNELMARKRLAVFSAKAIKALARSQVMKNRANNIAYNALAGEIAGDY